MTRRMLSPALTLAAAIAAGSAMDATIKHLAQTNHVLIVTLGRYVIGALFSFAIWLNAGRPRISVEMWRAHGLRGLVIACCATSFFFGLSVLAFAEAVTLSFIYPLIVPFAAAALIGERVRAVSVAAAGVGFAGVIVAAQGAPDPQADPAHAYGVAAVLFSAVMFALAMVLLRARAQADGAVIVGLMSSLIPGLVIAGPAILLAPPPSATDWPVFILMGALAAAFMYLIARAYAGAEAQQLAPVHYSELIWASLLGYVVFAEAPRAQVYLGAALIIAACLITARGQRGAAPGPSP